MKFDILCFGVVIIIIIALLYRSGVKLKDILNLIEELKKNYTFILQEDLRFKKEN